MCSPAPIRSLISCHPKEPKERERGEGKRAGQGRAIACLYLLLRPASEEERDIGSSLSFLCKTCRKQGNRLSRKAQARKLIGWA